MSILIFKTAHIIFVISWMAGLFYLGRMFVYHREAMDKPEPDRSILIKQISLMENRVYKIIMNPAMTLSWVFGLLMMYTYGLEWVKLSGWLHVKLVLLIALSGYHQYCKKVISTLGEGKMPMSSTAFRLFNEVPTVFMMAIVALAVFKQNTNPLILLISIVLIIILLVLFTMLYKKLRNKSR